MTDEIPPDQPPPPKFRLLPGGRKAENLTNVSFRDSDVLFHKILQAIKKIERRSSSIPRIEEISSLSGYPQHIVRNVILRVLPSQSSEFSLYLKEILATGENPAEKRRPQESQKDPGVVSITSALDELSTSLQKDVLELKFGVPYFSLSKEQISDLSCLNLLQEEEIRYFQAVPVEVMDDQMSIVMVNPNDLVGLNMLRKKLKGKRVKFYVCTEHEFTQFLHSVFD